MATHSSILAWRIPWPEEPSRLWPMGQQRVIMKLTCIALQIPYNFITYIMLHDPYKLKAVSSGEIVIHNHTLIHIHTSPQNSHIQYLNVYTHILTHWHIYTFRIHTCSQIYIYIYIYMFILTNMVMHIIHSHICMLLECVWV